MMDRLITAWYELLNGNITYNGGAIPVYTEDAPADRTSHYILLTAEGETDDSNNNRFEFNTVVVIQVVTVHRNNVKRSIVDDIDRQIFNLVLPSANANVLPWQDGIQIINVKRDTTTYLYEDDGATDKYYTKASRYNHKIIIR